MSRKIASTVFSFCAIFIGQAIAFAKGDTVKITLTNLQSGTPLEIADYAAVKRFNVWEGPGVNGAEVPYAKGFIVDWSKLIIIVPSSALARYQVKFYEGCKISESDACYSEEPSLAYVVTYVYNAATKQGYVYLPGKGDEFVDGNVRSIYRGVEGEWFMASAEWQSFVLPLIEGRAVGK